MACRYMHLYAFGHLRDFVRKRLLNRRRSSKARLFSHLHPQLSPSRGASAQYPERKERIYSCTIFGRSKADNCSLQGYAPIRQDYEDFYTRRLYYRLHVSIYWIYCCSGTQKCMSYTLLDLTQICRVKACVVCAEIEHTGPCLNACRLHQLNHGQYGLYLCAGLL